MLRKFENARTTARKTEVMSFARSEPEFQFRNSHHSLERMWDDDDAGTEPENRAARG
jgi:hypothetical protein